MRGLSLVVLWAVLTICAASDRVGRRRVIALSLVLSAAGHAGLALSQSYTHIVCSRAVTACGFQISLFRAYFATAVGSRRARTGSFGLIGVIQANHLYIYIYIYIYIRRG